MCLFRSRGTGLKGYFSLTPVYGKVNRVNPVPWTYVRSFGPKPQAALRFPLASKIKMRFGIGALPFGQLQNIHPHTQVLARGKTITRPTR
jgi:hypothetical protein